MLRYAKKRIYDQIKARVVPTDKNKFSFTVDHLVNTEKNIQKLVQIKGKKLSDEIMHFKTSDTIFILGSGPSINDIREEQWQYISRHDTVGFNYWFAHNFVPTFYIMQGGKTKRFQKILLDKKNDYKGVPFIIRGSWLTRDTVDVSFLDLIESDKLYYINEYAIHSECNIEPNKLINYFAALNLLSENKVHANIPKLYATVPMIMNLCYMMGYRKIVLCGIDMKDPSHFWDDPAYSVVREKYDLVVSSNSNIMMLNDKKIKKYTVPDAIYAQSDYYKKKNGTQVYIANKNTVLYPRLQVYFS